MTLSTELAEDLGQGEEGILRVHEALKDLEKADPRDAQMVQMRYFAGLSDKEIAEILDITERTVQRDWEKAKVLLLAILT
jgi:RNA polymerase sigma factor (sigma-70 family)